LLIGEGRGLGRGDDIRPILHRAPGLSIFDRPVIVRPSVRDKDSVAVGHLTERRQRRSFPSEYEEWPQRSPAGGTCVGGRAVPRERFGGAAHSSVKKRLAKEVGYKTR
jgi:hypothetical protein